MKNFENENTGRLVDLLVVKLKYTEGVVMGLVKQVKAIKSAQFFIELLKKKKI